MSSSSSAASAAAHPAGGVDARAEPEAERLLGQLGRLDGGHRHQRAQPGLARARQRRQPSRTMRRFSSRSGTRSQTVASAARSRSSSARSGRRRRPRAAPRESLSTTPGGAEHWERVGLARAPGCTSGQSGSSAPGRWWSVTTTSSPAARAAATCSTAVMPQSTVTSRPTPARGEPLDRGDREAVALVEAARQLPGRVGAERAQGADEHRRRADAVDVVVAEHGDPRAAPHVLEDQLAGAGTPGQVPRVVTLVRGEEAAGLLHGRRSRAARGSPRPRATHRARRPAARRPRPRRARTPSWSASPASGPSSVEKRTERNLPPRPSWTLPRPSLERG